MEDLAIQNMMKYHKLAKAIAEVSWYKFRTMIAYKASWYGKQLILAPTTFPSSQLCSNCGHRNIATKNLSIRTWVCPKCGATHDRDLNANMNLAKLAVA